MFEISGAVSQSVAGRRKWAMKYLGNGILDDAILSICIFDTDWIICQWKIGKRNFGQWNFGQWKIGKCDFGQWNFGRGKIWNCDFGQCNFGRGKIGKCDFAQWNFGRWKFGQWKIG